MISGYCTTFYNEHKAGNRNHHVMWLSDLFSAELISVPYNKKIDKKLRKSLDT